MPQGIVIQDNEGNEFVWVPVDSVTKGTNVKADDIRLGRYEDFATKNTTGSYVPKQEATNYSSTVTIDSYYQEKTSNDGNTAAKSLSTFVSKTNSNGGYYLGRYEASQGSDGKVDSQVNKTPWASITQPDAATKARGMYSSSYVDSDLINSYSWDTAIIFIQKYSGNSNYANKKPVNTSLKNTGVVGDKVCNIHDMASNCNEWSTEHSTRTISSSGNPCVPRGGHCRISNDTTANRGNYTVALGSTHPSFRPLLYLK